MAEETQFLFGPFQLDVVDRRVRKGQQAVELTPQAFTLLSHFVRHPGRLVTKDELRQAVWQETVVSDDALYAVMSEVRRALEDDWHAPQFLKTVSRQGYRFIASVTTPPSVTNSQSSVSSTGQEGAKIPQLATGNWSLTTHSQPLATDTWQVPTNFVGRERELQQLHSLLEKALAGERQIVFLTGEPGIGKTTLARAFLREVTTAGLAAVGRGQCIEQYGAGEAYLPVLEAIGRLCRSPGGEFLPHWLRHHAPTWFIQLPSFLEPADYEVLQRQLQGTTRERMLRELLEAIETLTPHYPLVLFLEDLHWSDYSTLALLSALARRSEPAGLLVIGTYRPAEGLRGGHPLRVVTQELRSHGQCHELALSMLNEAAVGEYVDKRFPASVLPTHLPQVLHQLTDGNPLFLVAVVDDLVGQGVIIQTDGNWASQGGIEDVTAKVPESIRQLIGRQIDRLTATEQQLLEAASVAGLEFSAAAVAAATERTSDEVERCCERLARRQHFLRSAGVSEWPDGTASARYRFRHALYQYLWHERVGLARQQQWHVRIGERQEQAYGNQTREIASELAMHFERGQDYPRAVRYLRQAAEKALRRSAYTEAIEQLTKALQLLKTFPDTPERTQQELMLHLALGGPLIAAKGYGAPEVEKAYARAFELCRQSKETPYLLQAQQGMAAFYSMRGQFQRARQLGEQCLSLAQQMGDPSRLLQAQWTLGQTLFHLGEFLSAREHVEHALALYDPRHHRSRAVQDLGVTSHSYLSWGLWFLGYPDQALATSHTAITLAQELSHSFSVAFALIFAAGIHQFCGDGHTAQELAEKAIVLCREQEFPVWLAFGLIARGWALAGQGQEEEGIAHMRQGLTAWKATGAEASRPLVLAMLAEAYGRVGEVEEGLNILEEALAIAHENEERYYEAELHRLKGELTLQQSSLQAGLKSKVPDPKSPRTNSQSLTSNPQAEAEAYFQKAIDIARRQSMKSLELRAVTSLSRLWRQQGKQHAARDMLSAIYNWFTEGLATADLREAKALLAELSKSGSAKGTTGRI